MKNKKNRFIPINRPDFNSKDIEIYHKYKYGQYEEYSKIDELEKVFIDYLGGEYNVVFTSSAKMSLYLLLKFLNMKGRIVSTPLTCFAALSPIIANGLSIHYADINTENFNLVSTFTRDLQTDDIGAIIYNYFGGSPFDIFEGIDYAKRNNITIIEDCAQSIGAEINSRPLGSFGDHSFFSFTKHFSLVGGGLLASKNKSLIEKIRVFQNKLPSVPMSLLDYRLKRDFIEKRLGDEAFDKSYSDNFLFKQKEYDEIEPSTVFSGTSVLCKPTDLQAAVILNQFYRLPELIGRRRKNAELLTNGLASIEGINTQKVFGNSAYAKYYIKVNCYNNELIIFLNKNGIDAKQLTKSHGFYMQLSVDKTKYYYDTSIKECNNYMYLFNHILELPLSSNMDNNEINYIIEHLKYFFNE